MFLTELKGERGVDESVLVLYSDTKTLQPTFFILKIFMFKIFFVSLHLELKFELEL